MKSAHPLFLILTLASLFVVDCAPEAATRLPLKNTSKLFLIFFKAPGSEISCIEHYLMQVPDLRWTCFLSAFAGNL